MVSDKNKAILNPLAKEEVRGQVARIRASHPFRTSKRCLALLDYVTEQALEGQLERLKERSLGVEVFGRDPGYDTSQDPVVRFTREKSASVWPNTTRSLATIVSYGLTFLPVPTFLNSSPLMSSPRRPFRGRLDSVGLSRRRWC